MAIWGRPVGLQKAPVAPRQDNAEVARRQYLWNTPDGKQPDFSETFTFGEDMLVSWNALNNSICDLWLTSWDLDPSPVALCLARAVYLGQDGNLKLVTQNPPSAQLANRSRYALRFKPPTSQGQFVASEPDLSSPGFFIVRASPTNRNNAALSTTATATATASAPPPLLLTTPSAAASSASTLPGPNEPAPNMTPSAAAGLATGLILAVALLAALEVAYLMWRRKRRRRRRRRREQGGEGGGTESTAASSTRGWMRFGKRGRGGVFVPVDKAEMPSEWMSPELPGDSDWGQAQVRFHELHGGGARGMGLGVRVVDGHDPPPRTITINTSLVELEAGRR